MNEGAPIIIKKKKSHGDHGHHGGSWKVAYADFVTAMMAFFMVMWIMGLSDQTRAQIAGYFNDPVGFMKNMPTSRSIVNFNPAPPQEGKVQGTGKDTVKDETSQAKELQKKLDSAMSSGDIDLKSIEKQVEMTVTSEGLQIELVENTGAVFFETGSAVVRPIARELVAKIAPVISRSGRKLIIEGHTDAKPYQGKNYTNWNLSTDRALALCELLMADGVPERQFMQVRGYASTKLKRPDDPFHFSNRRVTILLPFKNVSDPTLDLPKDVFESEKEGVFRQPLQVMPETPDIKREP